MVFKFGTTTILKRWIMCGEKISIRAREVDWTRPQHGYGPFSFAITLRLRCHLISLEGWVWTRNLRWNYMTENIPKSKWFKSHLLINGVILLVYFLVSCVIQLARIQTNDFFDCLDLLMLWLVFYAASFFVMRKGYRNPFFRAGFAAFFWWGVTAYGTFYLLLIIFGLPGVH